MTPRTTKSPHLGRKRTLLVDGFVALLALFLAAPSASATVLSVTPRPEEPTTCDRVRLVVNGQTPTPCYRIEEAVLEGPVELPTMGPIPTFEIRIRLVLREVPDTSDVYGGACPTVIAIYEHAFDLGRLRFGSYGVRTVEYLLHGNASPDTSRLHSSFQVQASEACPAEACALLGFGVQRPLGDLSCHASAPPGGRASLPITLTNSVPVGGVQTVLVPSDSQVVVVPVAVETTDRTAGFQLAWTAEGPRARVLLYSASGAEIAPGEGPVFHVIYQVSAHAEEQIQHVRLDESIVADPLGHTIPPCPTIALVVDWGRICIVKPGCDLNEDGTSNILDVVQLVNCALAGAGASEACPDRVAARADCNGDGPVDVRDVICCVRKILGSGGFDTRDPDSGTGDATRIGFLGPARWITPLTGRAEIRIEPGALFGGTDFVVDASSSGARIAGMRLAPESGYYLESHIAPDGSSARGMLVNILGGPVMPGGAGDANRSGGVLITSTILLDLVPSMSASGGGELSLVGAQSATRLALPMQTLVGNASAPIPEVATPAAPSVAAARPNPFRGETEIAYALPAATRATLRVYGASGRLVRTLVDSEMPAGVHRAHWDGTDSAGRTVGSGIYFFRFTAAEVTKTQRLMLLR